MFPAERVGFTLLGLLLSSNRVLLLLCSLSGFPSYFPVCLSIFGPWDIAVMLTTEMENGGRGIGIDALFRTGLAKDNGGVVVASPTRRAETVHIGAHIVITELTYLHSRSQYGMTGSDGATAVMMASPDNHRDTDGSLCLRDQTLRHIVGTSLPRHRR